MPSRSRFLDFGQAGVALWSGRRRPARCDPAICGEMFEEALRGPGPVLVDAIVAFRAAHATQARGEASRQTGGSSGQGNAQPNEDRSNGCLGYSSRGDLILKLRGRDDPSLNSEMFDIQGLTACQWQGELTVLRGSPL